MELQALLVLCGVGVAGVAVLLLMGLFTSSGTSYEEAIAQQRKATTELLALAENKNKPKKNSKKAIKKQAKKEKKETAAVATGSEPESEAPAESGVEDEAVAVANKGHVEFRPAVVVDIPRDTPPNVKIRKRGKDPKVKPILLNKEDPSCVSDPAALAPTPTTILNHFEEMHPKDEFELLQSTFAAEKPQEKVEEVVEKKESKPAKPAKVTKTAASKAAPAHEPVKEEAARERRDSGDAPKEQRKAKKSEKKPEKAVEEVVETVAEEVVPPLNAPQPSELTTEKLLKQAFVIPPAPSPAPTATPPGGKKKKKHEPNVLALMAGDSAGVNVGELVRVVREAALSRTEIQILTDALLNKHHDPLPQHSEWTEGPNDPMQKLKKQLADKEKALADEIEASQALHAKLKELRSTLNAERSRAAVAARAAEEGAAAARAERHTLQTRLQRLLDDNHALAQDKAMLQSKLSAEAEVQAQRVQMEMHIQRLSESEAALVQQIAALQQECAAHALEAGQARCDASTARDTCIMSQQHAADMAQQLQKANCAYAELEQQQLLAVRAEQCAQQELQERIAAMTELQNEMQRLSSRLQAAEANAEKFKEEAEKQRKQMTNDLKVLGEKLAARESELAELKALKAAPAQNGLPAASEELKSAEAMAAESAVAALREELSEAQRGARDQREQLATLSAQLHHYRDKNNELRTKNWKVMEALQSAEKALQMKATALPAQDLREAIAKAQEAHYNEVANVLRAVCPSAAPGSAVGREWLQNFADNLKKELLKRQTERQELEKRVSEQELEKRMTEKISAPVATAPPSDERVSELQSQNDQLQRLVDKYKRVIDDTEGVLSRLQQNVSAEERRWAQQLAEKQAELDELRHRTLHQEPLAFAYSCIEKSLPAIMEEMQSKIDSLEAQLSQTKANHNHSFADAERLTEERLMGGLSEKHNLDVCNGPSQVGLEEK